MASLLQQRLFVFSVLQAYLAFLWPFFINGMEKKQQWPRAKSHICWYCTNINLWHKKQLVFFDNKNNLEKHHTACLPKDPNHLLYKNPHECVGFYCTLNCGLNKSAVDDIFAQKAIKKDTRSSTEKFTWAKHLKVHVKKKNSPKITLADSIEPQTPPKLYFETSYDTINID